MCARVLTGFLRSDLHDNLCTVLDEYVRAEVSFANLGIREEATSVSGARGYTHTGRLESTVAEVLQTAVDPVDTLGDKRVHKSVRAGHVCRAHAPRGWDSGGTSRPNPRTHKWFTGRGTTPKQAFPFTNARTFPLPFTRTHVPPAWRVSPIPVPAIAVVTAR